jgi:multicomponent Na+:H+ antiporter subunit G
MELVLDLASWVLLMVGAFFALTGAIGVLRLPDVFTRLHAAGMTDTAGAGLILAGLMVQAGVSLVTVKLVFVLIFLVVTSPLSTHATARAAIHGGVKPLTIQDPGD